MSIIIKLRTFAQKMTIVDQSLHRKYETLKFDFANENGLKTLQLNQKNKNLEAIFREITKK